MSTREDQLEQENLILKERLYACYSLGLEEVNLALRDHLDVMNLDVYKHRSDLQSALNKSLIAQQDANADKHSIEARFNNLMELTKRLWVKLNDEDAPFPEV